MNIYPIRQRELRNLFVEHQSNISDKLVRQFIDLLVRKIALGDIHLLEAVEDILGLWGLGQLQTLRNHLQRVSTNSGDELDEAIRIARISSG